MSIDYTKEIWKAIPDYEVSDHGRVRSLDREVGVRGNSVARPCGRCQLRSWPSGSGYEQVCLSQNGIKRKWDIHRLVALAFIPNPERKKCVGHIDHDRMNNHVSNLEWCTQSENIKWTFECGRGEKVRKNCHKQGKKRAKRVVQLGLNTNLIVREWKSMTEAAESLGISANHICSVCKGRRRQTGGYRWKYA